MEKLVEELQKIVRFKDETEPGDLVLIAADEPQSLVYALITGIERDTSRRDEWWHVAMQVLTVPPQPTTWTLRTEQFTGREIFTMGGEKRYIRAVELGGKAIPDPGPPTGGEGRPRLKLVK